MGSLHRQRDFAGRRRPVEGQEWQEGLGKVDADGRYGDQAFQTGEEDGRHKFA